MCERVYTSEQAPVPDPGACPGTFAQFNSVIVIPERTGPGAVIVAMGAGGVAISGEDGSFTRVQVLDYGGESVEPVDEAEQQSILPVLAGPALLAGIGTLTSAHIARKRHASQRVPIVLCLLAAIGIVGFGAMSLAFEVRTTWIVTTVLSVAAFILAVVLAEGKQRAYGGPGGAEWVGKEFVALPAAPRTTNSSAIAALVLGIVGMFVFLTAPVAIVFGHKALRQIRATNQPGRSMAVTGLTLGYLITLLFVTFTIWIQG